MGQGWAALDKRLARLAAAFAPPPPRRSALDLAAELGLDLDPWQREAATRAAPRVLMNCARQTGKSTVAALIALDVALHTPGGLVLVLSPTERQSARLFRTIFVMYRRVGGAVPADVENRLSLELRNGAEVHALPGKEATIRGFSAVSLLVIDEAARVPDALVAGTRPMLAVSGGRLVALSTPFGTRGWWYEAWAHGGDAWTRYEVPASACPRISPAFLAEERLVLGEWWYAQEYECRFMDAQSAVFTRAEVDRMFAEPVEVWAL